MVVSLGVRDGERDLEPAEIACALATQIQSVINERYGQRATTVAVSTQPGTNITTARPRLQLVRASRHQHPNRPPATSAGAVGSGLADPGRPAFAGSARHGATGPATRRGWPLGYATPTRRSAPRWPVSEAPRLDPTTRPGDRHQFSGLGRPGRMIDPRPASPLPPTGGGLAALFLWRQSMSSQITETSTIVASHYDGCVSHSEPLEFSDDTIALATTYCRTGS